MQYFCTSSILLNCSQFNWIGQMKSMNIYLESWSYACFHLLFMYLCIYLFIAYEFMVQYCLAFTSVPQYWSVGGGRNGVK